jgi:hypothetical protein
MQGSGYTNLVSAFKTVVAVSASSNDLADLTDSPGSDTLYAGTPYTDAVDEAILRYPGSAIIVKGFPHVIARSTNGGTDIKYTGTINYMLDTLGNWQFVKSYP